MQSDFDFIKFNSLEVKFFTDAIRVGSDYYFPEFDTQGILDHINRELKLDSAEKVKAAYDLI